MRIGVPLQSYGRAQLVQRTLELTCLIIHEAESHLGCSQGAEGGGPGVQAEGQGGHRTCPHPH